MIIKKNSWHFRLIEFVGLQAWQNSLCPYMRRLFGAFIILALAVLAAIGLGLCIPVAYIQTTNDVPFDDAPGLIQFMTMVGSVEVLLAVVGVFIFTVIQITNLLDDWYDRRYREWEKDYGNVYYIAGGPPCPPKPQRLGTIVWNKIVDAIPERSHEYKPKKPGMLRTYIKSLHDKTCPMIHIE